MPFVISGRLDSALDNVSAEEIFHECNIDTRKEKVHLQLVKCTCEILFHQKTQMEISQTMTHRKYGKQFDRVNVNVVPRSTGNTNGETEN